MLMIPFSNSWAKEGESRSDGRENPKPLIQNFVAREMVGKTVRRQSAGLEITREFSGSATGRAEGLISRAKKALKVGYFVGSGSCHTVLISHAAQADKARERE